MNTKQKNKTDVLLVFPAEDAKSARWVSAETALEFELAAERNGLIKNRRDHKLYIGMPSNRKPPATQGNGNGIYYPSGAYLERHPENNDLKYQPGYGPAASPLVMGDKKTKLSPHFSFGEFFPNGPGGEKYDGCRVHPDLIIALEEIRAKVGAVIRVTSSYRPPDYNRRVGGVPNSQHLDGLAADIYCDDISNGALYDIVDAVIGNDGGVGFYPNFVHLDVRGSRARWQG